MRMTLKSLRLVALVLLLAAVGVEAQGPPNAQAILGKVGEAYSAVTTFHGEGSMEMANSSAGMHQTMQMPLVLDVKLPGAIRVVMNNGAARSLLVSDGHTTWLYMPTMNTYSKMEVPTGPAGQTGRTKPYDVLMKYRNLANRVQQASITRTETLTVNEKPANCWVLHVLFKRNQATGPMANQAKVKVQSSEGDLWVDQVNDWVLREDVETHMLMSGSPAETRMSVTFDKISMNPPLNDALFKFSPPSGAREIDLSKILSNPAGSK
jgi:outer membrane lipoprotein-sorting protein